MTREESAIIGAFTGVVCGPIDAMHEYIENILGRPVFTHELASEAICLEIKEKSKADFLLLAGNAGNNEEVESLKNECKRLYAICDDISTYGDQYKPEINGYFKAVEKKVCEGLNDGLLYSDGYRALFKDT